MFNGIINFIKKIRDLYLAKVKWRNYKIAEGFHAGRRVKIWGRKIDIGKCFYIGRDSQIECSVKIGDYVICGNRVAFVGRYDHNYHQVGVPIRFASQIRDKNYNWKGLHEITIVEDDVWIGYGTIIMSGVKIEKGSIIAAGSLVTKNVEKYSICGGVPAKKLKDRFNNKNELSNHISIYNKEYSNNSNL